MKFQTVIIMIVLGNLAHRMDPGSGLEYYPPPVGKAVKPSDCPYWIVWTFKRGPYSPKQVGYP